MSLDQDPMRLFVGVEVPRAAGSAIDVAMTGWREQPPGVRWSRPGDRHVTLAFLGDVEPADVPEIAERLDHVAGSIARFETSLGRIGGFPSMSHARILWVGLDDPVGAWARLAREIRSVLLDLVGTQPRAFVPHVTLGRSARPVALPRSVVQVVSARTVFMVEAVTLFRSRLDGSGARYERLERSALGGRV
jgi:RNA 2',3'-cyclic 3'-phosphodiesterase